MWRAELRVLADVCPFFPPATLHVAVVDPGVGTERALVYARICEQQFLAPDNGLLSFLAQRARPVCVIRLEHRQFWRSSVSRTFHGRDILAPVAAHLCQGLDPAELGPAHGQLAMLELEPPCDVVGGMRGRVVEIDSFGNLITNIESSRLPPDADRVGCRIRCRDRAIEGLINTYGDRPPGSLVALIGSHDRLEIACVGGSAAAELSAGRGDPVEVRWG